jgi:hypothetical protein
MKNRWIENSKGILTRLVEKVDDLTRQHLRIIKAGGDPSELGDKVLNDLKRRKLLEKK